MRLPPTRFFRIGSAGSVIVPCHFAMSTAALSLQAHAQPARALLERLFSTFEDVAYGLADRRDFEPTGRVSDVRELPALVRTTFGDNNLISVGVNHQVWRYA